MANTVVKSGARAVRGAVKGTARTAGKVARTTAGKAATKAETAIKNVHGPSPNPMTNLLIADIAIRGGGRLLRQVIERSLLGVRYTPEKARDIVKGRSMVQTLVGTAVARVATRSVPGALIVGGGMLAKTLYDRTRDRREAAAEGAREVEEQAKKA